MTQDTGANRPVSPALTGTTANKDRTLLIADDDAAFRNRIARALELRGFIVTAVGSVAEALAQTARPPAFAVLDLRLGDGNGLELVQPLRQARPDIRIVVLTGYGNIATAVAAVKEGAVDYLAKPAAARRCPCAGQIPSSRLHSGRCRRSPYDPGHRRQSPRIARAHRHDGQQGSYLADRRR